MNQNKRQKLCYQCEGEVDLDVIFCPFCGTDLLEEQENVSLEVPKTEETDAFRTLSAKESNSSLYPPPYQPKSFIDDEQEEEISDYEDEEVEKKTHSILPLIFLSIGGWLFLLAILLFIFSVDGFVQLKFDAKLWLVYLLLAVPCLYTGTKLLTKID